MYELIHPAIAACTEAEPHIYNPSNPHFTTCTPSNIDVLNQELHDKFDTKSFTHPNLILNGLMDSQCLGD